jgi:hypothetical protein
MIQSSFSLLMLLTSLLLPITMDTRYEKVVQYIRSHKEILAAVHETLPERFQADTAIVFTVADSLIRPLLSPAMVIPLKYGALRSNTTVYDSLQQIEKEKLYQYGQLYNQPLKLSELGSLSMHGNPHAVIFFSRPYDGILRALILPVKLVSAIGFNSQTEEISIIDTDFSRMSSFNRGVNILFLFDEKDSIKTVKFSSIVFD